MFLCSLVLLYLLRSNRVRGADVHSVCELLFQPLSSALLSRTAFAAGFMQARSRIVNRRAAQRPAFDRSCDAFFSASFVCFLPLHLHVVCVCVCAVNLVFPMRHAANECCVMGSRLKCVLNNTAWTHPGHTACSHITCTRHNPKRSRSVTLAYMVWLTVLLFSAAASPIVFLETNYNVFSF